MSFPFVIIFKNLNSNILELLVFFVWFSFSSQKQKKEEVWHSGTTRSCAFSLLHLMRTNHSVILRQLVDCQFANVFIFFYSGEEPRSICSRTSVSSAKQHSHKLECGTALGMQPRFKLDNNLCSHYIASLFQLQAQPFV